MKGMTLPWISSVATPGIACAGNGLQGDDENFLQAEGVGQRLEHQHEAGCGTIGIGHDEAGVVAALLLLHADGVEMRGVHFGNQQRNVGIHAVIFGVADDGIAGAREFFFGGASDAGIERGKNEIAVEGGLETFDDETARLSGMGVSRCQRTASA